MSETTNEVKGQDGSLWMSIGVLVAFGVLIGFGFLYAYLVV